MGISFFIYAHFFRNATAAYNKGWVDNNSVPALQKHTMFLL